MRRRGSAKGRRRRSSRPGPHAVRPTRRRWRRRASRPGSSPASRPRARRGRARLLATTRRALRGVPLGGELALRGILLIVGERGLRLCHPANHFRECGEPPSLCQRLGDDGREALAFTARQRLRPREFGATDGHRDLGRGGHEAILPRVGAWSNSDTPSNSHAPRAPRPRPRGSEPGPRRCFRRSRRWADGPTRRSLLARSDEATRTKLGPAPLKPGGATMKLLSCTDEPRRFADERRTRVDEARRRAGELRSCAAGLRRCAGLSCPSAHEG